MSTLPDMRGFTRHKLYRMHLIYEAYRDNENVSPLAKHMDVVDRGDEA